MADIPSRRSVGVSEGNFLAIRSASIGRTAVLAISGQNLSSMTIAPMRSDTGFGSVDGTSHVQAIEDLPAGLAYAQALLEQGRHAEAAASARTWRAGFASSRSTAPSSSARRASCSTAWTR